MIVTPLALPDVLQIEMNVYEDARGWFQEFWNESAVNDARVPGHFVQDNLVYSRRRVLRGLHFQQPHAQGKLVAAIEGEIFDVAVDIRPQSPSFGRWVGARLRAGSGQALYIPPGFAHGYQAVSDTAHVMYKCTEFYHPETDHCLAWNDQQLAVQWPLPDPIVSAKDSEGLSLDAVRELMRDIGNPS